MVCSSIVLPVRGGATINARCPLPDRSEQVGHPPRKVLAIGLHPQMLVRIERRQVVEEDLVARVRQLEVDRLDLDQREIALALFRRTDLARDGVPCAEVEFADLRRADVNVVGARR